MSSLQIVTIIGVPITVLLVAVALIALARPDGDNGVYASYLALVSVLSLYLLLLTLAATGESITQHLAVGDNASGSPGDIVSNLDVYFSLFTNGGASAIAGFASVAVLMAASFGFHARRRTELLASASARGSVERVDRAYRGAVCFAMVTLVAVGAMLAGSAGYNFFSQPIAGGRGDELRDLAMGSLLAYGGLVLVAGLVFRAHFWGIRGNDESTVDPDSDLVQVGET